MVGLGKWGCRLIFLEVDMLKMVRLSREQAHRAGTKPGHTLVRVTRSEAPGLEGELFADVIYKNHKPVETMIHLGKGLRR